MRPAGRIWVSAGAMICIATAGLVWAQSRDINVEAIRSERRIALVVGNGAYAVASLGNPVNDARAMTQALRGAGFDVIARENVDQREMRRAIIEFGNRLQVGGVGLFYFAGHGVQVAGRNYLIPIGAEIKSESEVEVEAIDTANVLARMETAKNRLNIVILDACRDNPFGRSFRSSSRGLASIDAPSGTMIAYATAPGRVASDGDGTNGLYTGELLKAIRVPGLKLEDVFKRVLAEVRRRTNGQQVPWFSSSVEGDFMFTLPVSTSGPAPSPLLIVEERRRLEEERRKLEEEQRAVEEQKRVLAERQRLEADRKRLEEERTKLAMVPPPPIPAGPPAQQEGVRVPGTGTVDVEVRYYGPPVVERLKVNKDTDKCGGETQIEKVLVGSNRGLVNAVVFIVGVTGGATARFLKKAEIDQNGCQFRPHIVAMQVGEIDIKNSDNILHNIHTYSTANPSINKVQPKFKKVMTEKFEKPEIIKLTCDVHSWMLGWVAVMPHQYFGVTDSNGLTRIENVPPGTHTVGMWHESLGRQTKVVEVGSGRTTRLTFELSAVMISR